VTASGSLATFVVAAEEPSKAPFYIAGGALALWALVVSAIGIAIRGRTSKPIGSIMMVVSAVLVVGAVAAAIGTAGEGEAEGQQEASPEEAGPVEESSPAESSGQAPQEGGTPSGALRLATDPGGQLKFDKPSLSTKAGEVTIALTNEAQVPHDVTIERGGEQVAKSDTVTGGETNVSSKLKPGRYTFFCSVGDHRGAGMEGTLTVE
jgi:plastocyanin